jgi:hypothetical protein
MIRRVQIALASLAVLFLTTGCMKVNMDLTVSENDTVSGSMILAFSNDAIELAESMGSDSALDTDSLVTEQPGLTIEPYKDADYAGTKITFDEKPFNEFSTGTTADTLQFKRDGDVISVTGAVNMAGDDPSTIEQIKTNPITAGLFEKSDISISITLPGKILETSGSVVGNTVTFKGELGDNITIDAKSDVSAGFDVLPLAIGGLALAGVVAGSVFVVNRRRAAPKQDTSPTSQFSDWE